MDKETACGWGVKQPGTGQVPYIEFPAREFLKAGMGEVDLGCGQSLDTNSGGPVSPKTVVDLLSSVKEKIIDHGASLKTKSQREAT